MTSIKFRVCSGSSCGPEGGKGLLRDLEELCSASSFEVEPWSCLGKCGQGPNVEVCEGRKTCVVTGVDSFSKALNLVNSRVGETPDLNGLRKKICKIKFDIRRCEDFNARNLKLKEAFGLLGGESEDVASREPKLLGELLLIRSCEVAQANRSVQNHDAIACAIKDAQRAATLTPSRAMAHEWLSEVLERGGRLHEALEALKVALRLGAGINSNVAKRSLRRIERKLRENEDDITSHVTSAVSSAVSSDQPKPMPSQLVADTCAPMTGSTAGDRSQHSSFAAPGNDAPPGFNTWHVETSSSLNHNCIQLQLIRKGSPATRPQDPGDNWHVDISLELDTNSGDREDVVRSYTPLTTFTAYADGMLHLMVKVYRSGRLTPHLGKLKAGDIVFVSDPRPTLLNISDWQRGVMMIAGGSAVTVALQVCQVALRRIGLSGRGGVTLVMCNRAEEDVLFRERFENMQRYCRNFRIVHCLSSGSVPDAAYQGCAQWYKGRLSTDVLSSDFSRQAAVISGPPGLCRTSHDILLQLKWRPSDIQVLDRIGEIEHGNCSRDYTVDGANENTPDTECTIDVGSEKAEGALASLWMMLSCRRRCKEHHSMDKAGYDAA